MSLCYRDSMVMRRTVERLRERPHDERRAVAGSIALSVVGVLFVGWVAFFLHGIGSGQEVEATDQQPTTQAQQAASVSPTISQWQSTVATTSDQTPTPTMY